MLSLILLNGSLNDKNITGLNHLDPFVRGFLRTLRIGCQIIITR